MKSTLALFTLLFNKCIPYQDQKMYFPSQCDKEQPVPPTKI